MKTNAKRCFQGSPIFSQVSVRLFGTLVALSAGAPMVSPALAKSSIVINGVDVTPSKGQRVEPVEVRMHVPSAHVLPGHPNQAAQGFDTYRWDSRQMRWDLDCPGGDDQSLRCDVREIRNRLRQQER